jgi:hypothetical protein
MEDSKVLSDTITSQPHTQMLTSWYFFCAFVRQNKTRRYMKPKTAVEEMGKNRPPRICETSHWINSRWQEVCFVFFYLQTKFDKCNVPPPHKMCILFA